MNPKAPEFIPGCFQKSDIAEASPKSPQKSQKKTNHVYSIIVSMFHGPIATLTSDNKGNIIMGGLYGTSIYRDIEGTAYRSFKKATGQDLGNKCKITTLHVDYEKRTSYCAIFVDGTDIHKYKPIFTKTGNRGFAIVSFDEIGNKKIADVHKWKTSYKFKECLHYLKQHTRQMAQLNAIIEK